MVPIFELSRNLDPITISYWPDLIGATKAGICCGLCCPSASNVIIISALSSNAFLIPSLMVCPIPRFTLWVITTAPAVRAMDAVPSLEPSSATMTSSTYGLVIVTTCPIVSASLNAGITATIFFFNKYPSTIQLISFMSD